MHFFFLLEYSVTFLGFLISSPNVIAVSLQQILTVEVTYYVGKLKKKKRR